MSAFTGARPRFCKPQRVERGEVLGLAQNATSLDARHSWQNRLGVATIGVVMRTALRLLALTVALVGVVLWLFGGPNLGWTQTTVIREEPDPVTGLVGRFPEDRFLPGVDFLAASLLLAAALGGGSFFFRRK